MKKSKLLLTLFFIFLFSINLYAFPIILKSGTFIKSIQTLAIVIWDNALVISIILIFIGAIIGFFFKARAVDKCLKDFEDFNITVKNKDNTKVQGNLKLYSTGMELIFEKPEVTKQGFNRYSEIIYKSEYDKIDIIYRFQDKLSLKNQKKREKDIKKTYRPSLMRKFFRWLRNILGTFRDAIAQSLGLIVGQMKKTSPLLKSNEKRIKSLGTEIISHTGNTYDPILEKYIGYKVIVEVNHGDTIKEYWGIFKEYSKDFLEILNIPFEYEIIYNKKEDNNTYPLEIKIENNKINIRNLSNVPTFIERIDEKTVNTTIGPNDNIDIENNSDDKESYKIIIKRIGDMIVSRKYGTVRYGSDTKKMNWKNIVKLDIDIFK